MGEFFKKSMKILVTGALSAGSFTLQDGAKSPLLKSDKDFVAEQTINANKQEEVLTPDELIKDQISKIKEIIESRRYKEILSNHYLAYSIYYSESFLRKISDPSKQETASEKIIGSIAPFITPEFREQAILFLAEETKKGEALGGNKISTYQVLPLKNYNLGTGFNHLDAIDLFGEELSPVHSMSDGLVIIADNGWNADDELSTSSEEGGNTVVIFNYLTGEFYRYAHLHEVMVMPGDLVTAGQSLGTLGHTGGNASKPGHGKHLHLEINKYSKDKYSKDNKNTNHLLKDIELRGILKKLKYTR